MKILIVGLGSVGKKHVKVLRSILPHAEIFSIRSNRDAEEIEGIINLFRLDEIDSTSFDFAIIANPTSEHIKTINQLIEFNFPLFIEKPLYSSLSIGDLIESITINEIHSYVACNLRFLDCIRFIKALMPQLMNKRLNEVNVYCGSYLPDWRPNMNFRKTYSANANLGGGVHLDLIHELDYLYWFFGKPTVIQRYFKSQSSLSISSLDYANYILDYDSFCTNVILNYFRRDPRRSLELVFEDETWNVDLLKNQVTCNSKILFTSEQRIADTYQEQMNYFINSIIYKAESFNTVNDAYEVLKICLEK